MQSRKAASNRPLDRERLTPLGSIEGHSAAGKASDRFDTTPGCVWPTDSAGGGGTMKGLAAAALCAAMLAGCVSTEMRGYVGKSADELLISYGRPENVIELADGRRAYQFRSGGGSYVAPGVAQTTAVARGNTVTATTYATPAAVYSSAGCLLTFIVGKGGTVEEYRVPKDLVC